LEHYLLGSTCGGVAVGAAYGGYGFGEKSLEDVSMPSSADATRQVDSLGKSEGFIAEAQVLSQVQAAEQQLRAQGLTTLPLATASTQPGVDLNKSDIFDEPEVVAAAEGDTTAEVSSESVSFKVNGVHRTTDALVLDVTLNNQGDEDRRFLYGDAFNLLILSDENGKRLSTLTTDLPGDLPANGEQYAGSIEVPLDELADAHYLRLSLKDYPDRKVNLLISSLKIPT